MTDPFTDYSAPRRQRPMPLTAFEVAEYRGPTLTALAGLIWFAVLIGGGLVLWVAF